MTRSWWVFLLYGLMAIVFGLFTRHAIGFALGGGAVALLYYVIPQLYVGGEFVGGSDIMMEMYESGELAELLRGDSQAA